MLCTTRGEKASSGSSSDRLLSSRPHARARRLEPVPSAERGGHELTCGVFVRHLREEGHEVRVLTSDHPPTRRAGEEWPDVHLALGWRDGARRWPRGDAAQRPSRRLPAAPPRGRLVAASSCARPSTARASSPSWSAPTRTLPRPLAGAVGQGAARGHGGRGPRGRLRNGRLRQVPSPPRERARRPAQRRGELDRGIQELAGSEEVRGCPRPSGYATVDRYSERRANEGLVRELLGAAVESAGTGRLASSRRTE
jgi:hypothetical protein